jgi:saccharopine dehydrogenase-like NADP-dependent oxidoreductase
MLEIGLGSRSLVKVGEVMVEPREVFKKILEKNLSYNDPDMVLVRLTFEGIKDEKSLKIVYEIIDRQDARTGLTSMMRMTAFPVSTIAWMACAGRIEQRGVLNQETSVDPSFFIAQLKKRKINVVIKAEWPEK